MNKLLPFLVVSLFFLSLIPIGSSTVTVYTGTYFYVGNETYGVTQTMNFSYIQHNSAWIKFNATDFNVTSANDIYINLSFLHEDISTATASDEILDFVANVSSGVVGFSIGGFKSSNQYVVKRNSTQIATPTSNADGYIYFTNNVWSHKHFEIYDDASSSPPNITINFAGNLSDSGGPYYRPPYEVTQLTGVHSDGYYTNDSRQHEGWIYINCSVEDDGTVSDVWLQWLNETTWTNYTYAFTDRGGNYWDINTSNNFSTAEEYNYSFNVVANDSTGSSTMVEWNKTGIGENFVRRYVQLNCTSYNLSYSPFYLVEDTPFTGIYTSSDTSTPLAHDRLHHDQGPNGMVKDTGYMHSTLPGSSVGIRNCSGFIGYWFEENNCSETFEMENAYYHVWWSADNNEIWKMGFKKQRTRASGHLLADSDYVYTSAALSKSNIFYDNGIAAHSNDYYLHSGLHTFSSVFNITDNNIFELIFLVNDGGDHPSVVNNRSFMSYILINVPVNATLQGLDSDSDGLNDYEELYLTYTNPFVSDTDNDGYSDYYEEASGSDPNNYSDASGIGAPILSSPSPTDGSSGSPTQLSIAINDPSGQTFNWTIDSSPDIGNDSAFGESNGTKTSSISGMVHGTVYTWQVNCTNSFYWTNATYSFTFEYAIDPPYNGSSTYNTTANDLNLTWTRGNYSDQEVVVKNTANAPTSHTDGTVMQNSTNTSYNESITSFAYYTIWSYNSTSNIYSSTGLNIPWGALGLNCFNESNMSQSIGFDILITNSDGTITYNATDLTNTHHIDLNDIPYGDDTIFVISNSSYRQRIYYHDLALNNFYNYTFYLPPITTPVDPGSGDDGGNTTATQLYFVQVIDEASNALSDVDITVKRYDSTEDSYEIMGSMITGGYGYTSIYLVPNTLYKVVANKSGYVERIENWLTDPIYYGLSYPNVIQLELEETEYTNETTFNEAITFEAYMNSTGTIFVNYSDVLEETVTTNICIYENITLDVFHWDNRTGDDSFQVNASGANSTRSYQIVLIVNHTTFGEQVVILFIIGEDMTYRAITTPTRFNTLFNANYGTSPGGFGWSNFFGFFILLVGVFSFGQRDVGVSMLITGGLLLFINTIIGLSIIGVTIPILFIVLGILVQWRNHRKEAVG